MALPDDNEKYAGYSSRLEAIFHGAVETTWYNDTPIMILGMSPTIVDKDHCVSEAAKILQEKFGLEAADFSYDSNKNQVRVNATKILEYDNAHNGSFNQEMYKLRPVFEKLRTEYAPVERDNGPVFKNSEDINQYVGPSFFEGDAIREAAKDAWRGNVEEFVEKNASAFDLKDDGAKKTFTDKLLGIVAEGVEKGFHSEEHSLWNAPQFGVSTSKANYEKHAANIPDTGAMREFATEQKTSAAQRLLTEELPNFLKTNSPQNFKETRKNILTRIDEHKNPQASDIANKNEPASKPEIMDDDQKAYALMQAVNNRDVKVAEKLLKDGADATRVYAYSDGKFIKPDNIHLQYGLVSIAVGHADKNMVTLLLNHNPELSLIQEKSPDGKDINPILHVAVALGNNEGADMIRTIRDTVPRETWGQLLAQKAPSGKTAFDVAKTGWDDSMQALLEGIEPTKQAELLAIPGNNRKKAGLVAQEPKRPLEDKTAGEGAKGHAPIVSAPQQDVDVDPPSDQSKKDFTTVLSNNQSLGIMGLIGLVVGMLLGGEIGALVGLIFGGAVGAMADGKNGIFHIETAHAPNQKGGRQHDAHAHNHQRQQHRNHNHLVSNDAANMVNAVAQAEISPDLKLPSAQVDYSSKAPAVTPNAANGSGLIVG